MKNIKPKINHDVSFTDDFINDMKNGEEYELSREDMSDWIIYTPSMTINANNVYMYNKLYNNAGSERNS